jgi:nicotinate phosphoribosyltransferase
MSDPEFGYVTPETLGLFTDLYEFRMMEGYLETGHTQTATFDLFVRDLPPNRGYLVAAGLEQAVASLDSLAFDERALSYLAETGAGEVLLEFLVDFSFSGEVRAVPEGTVVFPNEPLLEVTAPLAEAQLFETLLINQVGYQTLIASKAARMRDAVDRLGADQSLVDFGSRRAHGTDAGLKAARAATIGGFDGTSNVAAGEAFDLPVFGTMAHSWVQSFPTEREAFEAFVSVYGADSTLLIDTYDTVAGARLARAVAADMGVAVRGVRLDSGDLVALSKAVAEVVPEMDLFISSSVDEYGIEAFLRDGGVAHGFGPGTALTTSADAPKLEAVYKLVAVERDGELRPSMKLSPGKVTYPGEKSVRRRSDGGRFVGDTLARRGEDLPGEDLLVTVFEGGERVAPLPTLAECAARRAAQVAALPDAVRALTDPGRYPVEVSEGLERTAAEVRASLVG